MCDLLPSTVHQYLHEVEGYVALPVLTIIVLCTIQLIFCQVTQVATTVAEILKRRAECKPKKKCPRPCPSILDRLTGMFCTRSDGKCKKMRSIKRTYAALPGEKSYDDWDDNDEFDDDEEIDDIEHPDDD